MTNHPPAKLLYSEVRRAEEAQRKQLDDLRKVEQARMRRAAEERERALVAESRRRASSGSQKK